MSDFETTSHEAAQLEALGKQFFLALEKKDAGDFDGALQEFQAILKVEPRLAEPRMELARMLLDLDRTQDAEEHARQALEDLENHGQWVDTIDENQILALAHAILAEALRRRVEEDDVIFGDPEQFKALLVESRTHFNTASELDPSDEYSSYHAFFMGPEEASKVEV